MLAVAYGIGPEFVLIHYNARACVVCITRVVLQELDIQEMEWPVVSSDVNPIEHVWDRLNKVFVGILFHHRLSKTLNRLLLKNGT